MSPRESVVRELTLEELLIDPLVRLVMNRDGVREHDIRALAERAAETRI
ncbi:MAG: hypothetical protein WD034_08345 [Parvibaculum sp.]